MSNNETIEFFFLFLYFIYISPLDPSFDNKADPSCKPHQRNSIIVSDPKDLTFSSEYFVLLIFVFECAGKSKPFLYPISFSTMFFNYIKTKSAIRNLWKNLKGLLVNTF